MKAFIAFKLKGIIVMNPDGCRALSGTRIVAIEVSESLV